MDSESNSAVFQLWKEEMFGKNLQKAEKITSDFVKNPGSGSRTET